jgi:hypothetical protein
MARVRGRSSARNERVRTRAATDAWIGLVVAERELDKPGTSGRPAVIRIGLPRLRATGEFECPMEIRGLGRQRRLRAFGVDAVQALILGFVLLRRELAQIEGAATWLEQPAHEGIPLVMPVHVSDKYARRVEAAMERATLAYFKRPRKRATRRA